MFVDSASLHKALSRLHGTADHLIKIWFTLKHMGLREGASPVRVTTSNPTPSLERLFGFGSDTHFFVPFAHTARFKMMKNDAGRSIIQTSIKRWAVEGSVVTVDPTSYLEFRSTGSGFTVAPSRDYPVGLGVGRNGFALGTDEKLSIPAHAFAVWHFRKTPLTQDETLDGGKLIQRLKQDLSISDAEFVSVFDVADDPFAYTFETTALQDSDINAICMEYVDTPLARTVSIKVTTPEQQERLVRSMKTISSGPAWLTGSPTDDLEEALGAGEKAIVLYGPPRTGKTRAISELLKRKAVNSSAIEHIQIHAGWTYDNLIEMFAPDTQGVWDWHSGPLKKAIRDRKQFIILEEANRTDLAQALGEVFSLIEQAYRGPSKAIKLRSGQELFVPEETVFLFTMNTIDRGTEEVDDALFGRLAAIEFPPRVEDLTSMLVSMAFPEDRAKKVRELFAFIQAHYPLGHGYFADVAAYARIETFYKLRIRPVLYSHFHAFDRDTLTNIDNMFDALIND